VMPVSQIHPVDITPTVTFGGALELGRKETQEDFAVCVNLNSYISKPPNNDMRMYCAIFDGHGGGEASKFLASEFHKVLAHHPLICSDPSAALQETWRIMDEKLYQHLSTESGILRDGSTATVCLIVGSHVYIANCGDSSAFVQRSDGTLSKATEDHSTANPAEVDRCHSAGAAVHQSIIQTSLFSCCPFSRSNNLPLRVYPGGLMVTRSFGDFYAKIPGLGGLREAIIHHHGPVEKYLLPGDLRMVVLASDGVWDALKPAEVFKMIKRHIESGRMNCNLKADATALEDGPWEENLIANRQDLNEMLTTAARDLCISATVSDFWRKNRYAADNASCIIIALG